MQKTLLNEPKNALSLSCCIDASEEYIPKARYALKMLLMPLGINPRWVSQEALPEGGLFYGRSAGHAMPEAVISFKLDTATEAFFAERTAFEASHAKWRNYGEQAYPVLFGGESEKTDDLIASAFFWLSGWQEYTVRERDRHGRFPYAASLQASLRTIEQPTVDIYREVLAGRLVQAGIPIKRRTWGTQTWAFCPTHDIDYLRKWRPGMIYREVIEYFAANRLAASFGSRLHRLKAFAADAVRPGDIFRKAFDRMIVETMSRGGRATYFIKTGAHGPNDVYYRTQHPYLLKKVKELEREGFEVGLHPSYFAHTHAGYLWEEKSKLSDICETAPVSVRQHYLRYELPATPRHHVSAGFRIDTSLAFADHEGFRRATCHPFQVYDTVADKPLEIWEMPLCLMDGTVFNYRKLQGKEAQAITQKTADTCKAFGGVCVALWHNTLWDEMDFPGWGQHFLETMDYALAQGARIDSLRSSLEAYFRN